MFKFAVGKPLILTWDEDLVPPFYRPASWVRFMVESFDPCHGTYHLTSLDHEAYKHSVTISERLLTRAWDVVAHNRAFGTNFTRIRGNTPRTTIYDVIDALPAELPAEQQLPRYDRILVWCMCCGWEGYTYIEGHEIPIEKYLGVANIEGKPYHVYKQWVFEGPHQRGHDPGPPYVLQVCDPNEHGW
jgi:hypothetical protein